ncbi:MAG: bifunctional protein-serine/threonine kinase/phosphatase [Alteromonadaceae bacterium]|nr:bifunctional protein-serine/threonine kinase/phosphatase [Alteromonadaceae bacterium]
MSDAVQKSTNKSTHKSQAKLSLAIGGYSCAGIKSENQDAFAAHTPSNYELVTKGAVAVLADGVSSASKAAEAAQMAVTQFIAEYYATPETWSTKKSAGKVLNSLNQWLFSQGSVLETPSFDGTKSRDSELRQDDNYYEQYQQWLTTFTALIIKSTTGFVFHVGDSRLSLFQQQKIRQITKDHNQKQGRNNIVLTRALGADSRLKVDVHQLDLQENDLYMLSCDGVHDFISKKVLRDILLTLPLKPDNQALEQVSKTIVEQALAAGSDDNVSCLLVSVNQLPTKQLDEIERELLAKAIPPALKVGQKIDGYKVLKVLHASTRSHLYLVQQDLVLHEQSSAPALKQKTNQGIKQAQPLVLKAPSANFIDDSIYLQGFIREAWVGERIDHTNVMRIKEPEHNSQFLYHLCEHIDGQTLTDWMHDNPKPTIEQVRNIVRQLVAALRAFQRLELVHRDLHPDNVMINANGQIKLIDYGTVWVAALAEKQDTLIETMPQGSLDYIAPETLISLKATYQSDLFSLGVIGYQLLCGELPFKPFSYSNMQQVIGQSRQQQNFALWQYRSIKQFRPELPLWLDLMLEHATAPDITNRYDAYSELLTDLTTPNIAAVEAYQQQPLLQRNPVKFWQTTSLVLFIALIAALLH